MILESKKITRILWTFAALSTLILLGFTINLTIQSRARGGENNQSVRAYLQSSQPLIIILAEPDERSLVASIQESGTSVIVMDYLRRSGEDWYQIYFTETEVGWVQGEYLSLEKP